MTPRTAAVIGLGLMGGSLARDLAARGTEVVAADRDPEAVRAARAEGVVAAELPPSLEGVERAGLVVLAVPVGAAPALLERLAPRLPSGALVTDLGSTKRSVTEAAERLGIGGRFVGSHPLAGDHRSGWGASRAGLFAGARVFLCPAASARADAVAAVRELWVRLGARPEALDAATHDRRLARTSHLPQIASTALARTLDAAGATRSDLGPGGRDATRLAASSPEMWASIALDNAVEIGDALDSLGAELAAAREALRRGDGPTLRRFFAGAAGWARADAEVGLTGCASGGAERGGA